MTEVILENVRLGASRIHPKGVQFEILSGEYDLEVWPIVKELSGDAQVVGYVIRMVE